MTTHDIHTWFAGQISEADFRKLCELHHAAFPRDDRRLEDVMAKKRPLWMEQPLPEYMTQVETPRRFVILDGDRPVANLGHYGRVLRTVEGHLPVLAIMDVATAPDQRGQGFGGRLVREAFKRVDDGDYRFCLFQTGDAKDYYRKLGARLVDNVFLDSTRGADEDPADPPPFKEPYVMVYPADGDWPTGEVDLRGPGW